MQVMRLGSNVQSFSLSPLQELLATVHEDNRGIFLWANQFIYRGATEIMPSEVPVDISLPSISAGNVLFPVRHYDLKDLLLLGGVPLLSNARLSKLVSNK